VGDPEPKVDHEPDVWTDDEWDGILLAIRTKMCTPFLGAGACHGILPLGTEVAQRWATAYGYPFDDPYNLPRVAQFVAIHREGAALTPRLKIAEELMKLVDAERRKGYPALKLEDEPHRIMADLELPLYITTNYDDFMVQALTLNPPITFKQRTVRREFCDWRSVRRRRRANDTQRVPFPEPQPETPIVYHLHGWLERPDSMVLTEDDFLDFLVFLTEDPQIVEARLQDAFATTALLFLGYSLQDLNFQVLLRQLGDYMARNEGARHVSVQLAPQGHETDAQLRERADKQRRYLEEKYRLQKVKVYWGTCRRFAAELRRKWNAAQ